MILNCFLCSFFLFFFLFIENHKYRTNSGIFYYDINNNNNALFHPICFAFFFCKLTKLYIGETPFIYKIELVEFIRLNTFEVNLVAALHISFQCVFIWLLISSIEFCSKSRKKPFKNAVILLSDSIYFVQFCDCEYL